MASPRVGWLVGEEQRTCISRLHRVGTKCSSGMMAGWWLKQALSWSWHCAVDVPHPVNHLTHPTLPRSPSPGVALGVDRPNHRWYYASVEKVLPSGKVRVKYICTCRTEAGLVWVGGWAVPTCVLLHQPPPPTHTRHARGAAHASLRAGCSLVQARWYGPIRAGPRVRTAPGRLHHCCACACSAPTRAHSHTFTRRRHCRCRLLRRRRCLVCNAHDGQTTARRRCLTC